MKNPDRPAYPYPDMAQFDMSLGEMMGLTKREWLAGQAMQGFLANGNVMIMFSAHPNDKLVDVIPRIAEFAYAQADAMLNKEISNEKA